MPLQPLSTVRVRLMVLFWLRQRAGKKGKAVVNYDFSIGWQNPWRKMSVLNATEYETIMNEAYVNAGMDLFTMILRKLV